jgi:hypothetical protein
MDVALSDDMLGCFAKNSAALRLFMEIENAVH